MKNLSNRGLIILGLSSVFGAACGGAEDSTAALDMSELSVRAEPAGQMFAGALNVSLLSSRPAQIFYTLDGSAPSANSAAAISYEGQISLSKQTLLSFIAVADDGSWSTTRTELYLKPNEQPPPTPAPRVLDLSSNTLFFEGAPGKSEPVYRTVALRSIGTDDIDIKTVALQSNPNQSIFYDPDAFDIVTDFQPTSLAAGESLVIEIMYLPSPTLRSDVLLITSNEQRQGGVQTVELWGRIADW